MTTTKLETGAAELAQQLGGTVRIDQKPKPAAKPADKPAKPAGASLLAKIVKAGKKLDGGVVAEAIATANTILGDQDAVATFVTTMEGADALAEQKFGFGNQPEEDLREWSTLGVPQIRSALSGWASGGDEVARQLLDTLNAFGESKVDVVAPLWRLYTELIRRANRVYTYYDLTQLLRDLANKRLLKTRSMRRDCPGWHEDDILLDRGPNFCEGFRPEDGNQMVMVSWPWFVKAMDRARKNFEQRQEKFRGLQTEAETDPVTPEGAEQGLSGKTFIVVDETMGRGALLDIKSNEQCPCVRIVAVVGMAIRPGGWIRWDASPKAWPDGNLYRAFVTWKQKR